LFEAYEPLLSNRCFLRIIDSIVLTNKLRGVVKGYLPDLQLVALRCHSARNSSDKGHQINDFHFGVPTNYPVQSLINEVLTIPEAVAAEECYEFVPNLFVDLSRAVPIRVQSGEEEVQSFLRQGPSLGAKIHALCH